jgi:hypothetical protein
MRDPPEHVGVVASNGPAYVDEVLSLLDGGRVAVTLARPDARPACPVDRVIRPPAGSGWLHRAFHGEWRDDVAMIAHTSGTSGVPKGVVLTHANLADTTQRLADVMSLDDSVREYLGTPVYHSFGFGRCRAVLSRGGAVFVPARGFHPTDVAKMLERGEINALSVVPSLARLLLANRDVFAPVADRMRWIEIGSQYIARRELEALKNVFPHARIVLHYGLTEASRSTFLDVSAESGAALETVGSPVGRSEVRIDEAGRIAIRGPHVARGVLIAGETVAATDADGWLHTQDLGRMCDGRLVFLGRADDVINCGGIKLDPETLEAGILRSLGLEGGIAVARTRGGPHGEGVLVAVSGDVPVSRERVLDVARSAAAEAYGVHLGDAVSTRDVDAIPRTATGKVQRGRLVELGEAPIEVRRPGRGRIRTVRAAFVHALGVTPRASDSFVSLGGDSLSFVQLSLNLERVLGLLPDQWEQMTVAELESHPSRPPAAGRHIETGVLLRALAILSVVNTHTGMLPVALPGGTFALMLLAGLSFSRFQASYAVRTGSARAGVRFLTRLMGAYVSFVVPYALVFDKPLWPLLLMYSSFSHPEWIGAENWWFLEALVPIHVVLLGVLLLHAVRIRYARAPFRWSVALVAVGVAVQVLWVATGHDVRTALGSIALFAVGMSIHHASTPRVRWTATGLALGVALLQAWSTGSETDFVWPLVAGVVTIWSQRLTLPAGLAALATLLAAASLHIYLAHELAANVVTKFFDLRQPTIRFLAGILGGIAFWGLHDAVVRGLHALRDSRPRPVLRAGAA